MGFQTKRLKILMSPMMFCQVHAWTYGQTTFDDKLSLTEDCSIRREFNASLLPCHKHRHQNKRCCEAGARSNSSIVEHDRRGAVSGMWRDQGRGDLVGDSASG